MARPAGGSRTEAGRARGAGWTSPEGLAPQPSSTGPRPRSGRPHRGPWPLGLQRGVDPGLPRPARGGPAEPLEIVGIVMGQLVDRPALVAAVVHDPRLARRAGLRRSGGSGCRCAGCGVRRGVGPAAVVDHPSLRPRQHGPGFADRLHATGIAADIRMPALGQRPIGRADRCVVRVPGDHEHGIRVNHAPTVRPCGRSDNGKEGYPGQADRHRPAYGACVTRPGSRLRSRTR
jgi:hypothetical protein